MASTDVATRDDQHGEVDLSAADRRRLNALYRECQRIANSALVPKNVRGDADTVFALARYGEMYGLPPIHSVQRLWLIEGRIEPSAEVLAGVVMDAGHELRWDEISSERCTVSIRRRGTDYFQTLTWTIQDAERAGLLDEWVERWVKNAEGRNRKETWNIAKADPPEWARKLIDSGQVKRNENWWRYPGDMLAAKALRRAAKRFCGDAMLAIDDGEGMDVVELTRPVRVATAPDPGPGDDDPPDGEPFDQEPDVEGEGEGEPVGDDEATFDEDGIEDADVVADDEPADEAAEPDPVDESHAGTPDPGAHKQALLRLMKTCGEAFPENDAPKGRKTHRQRLLRRAAQYAVLKEHRPANDLDVDELERVEAWVHRWFVSDSSVTKMTYEILDGDVVRFTLGDKTVDVPPDDPAEAA